MTRPAYLVASRVAHHPSCAWFGVDAYWRPFAVLWPLADAESVRGPGDIICELTPEQAATFRAAQMIPDDIAAATAVGRNAALAAE